MDKAKRSYFLPSKLVALFDRECTKGGYVRERVVAAAIANFLKASPVERHEMFVYLDQLMTGGKAKK